jgi:hypothetical protein
MTSVFLVFVATVIFLLLVLIWATRRPSRRLATRYNSASLEDNGRRHVIYLPQMRQALSSQDFEFLSSLGYCNLAARLRKERRQIALTYLPTIRDDFSRLLRLARVIAILSPRVRTVQEGERLNLTIQFYLRYEVVRLTLAIGGVPLPQLGNLSQMVSELAVRMETAMKELGERAALAGELASSLDNADLS